MRSEVCASNIGRLFGFSVQKTWLCKIPQYKEIHLRHPFGVLIQLDVRRERETRRNQFSEDLLHGAALISLVDKTFASLKSERERRKVYTLSLVIKAIRNFVNKHKGSKDIWDQFFELLTFDALIGGTDRHYNNWGILKKADSGEFIRLTPAFDNGISLMWKMDEYRPKFMKDLLQGDFLLKAESMFKKDSEGKYSLYEVLEELYKRGDFKKSNIVETILRRLDSVKKSRIRSVIMKNVPRNIKFRTSIEELEVISTYVTMRLDILKRILYKLRRK